MDPGIMDPGVEHAMELIQIDDLPSSNEGSIREYRIFKLICLLTLCCTGISVGIFKGRGYKVKKKKIRWSKEKLRKDCPI